MLLFFKKWCNCRIKTLNRKEYGQSPTPYSHLAESENEAEEVLPTMVDLGVNPCPGTYLISLLNKNSLKQFYKEYSWSIQWLISAKLWSYLSPSNELCIFGSPSPPQPSALLSEKNEKKLNHLIGVTVWGSRIEKRGQGVTRALGPHFRFLFQSVLYLVLFGFMHYSSDIVCLKIWD